MKVVDNGKPKISRRMIVNHLRKGFPKSFARQLGNGFSGCPIPVALISKLRKDTGASIQRCKEALEKSGSDVCLAIEFLRKRGQSINATALGNSGKTCSSRICGGVTPCHTRGIISVTTAQTDFATESELFVRFSEELNRALLRNSVTNTDPSLALNKFSPQIHGSCLSEVISEVTAVLAEPVTAQSVELIEGDVVSVYLHNRSPYSQNVATMASAVSLSLNDVPTESKPQIVQLASHLARQVLATSPRYVSSETVPESVIESEKAVLSARVTDPTKLEKAFQGHMKRFKSENCLMDMEWIIPTDFEGSNETLTVRDVIGQTCDAIGVPRDSISVNKFVIHK